PSPASGRGSACGRGATPSPRVRGEGRGEGQLMLAYIGKRLLATIPVMAIVAIFVFALLRLTPGDPAAIIAGSAATSQDVAAIRVKLALDRPLVTHFFV